MSVAWSSSQQRMLTALGFNLYRPVRDAAPAPDDGMGGDRLALAVLRAAGGDASAAVDVAAWWRARRLPELSELRASPAAKRALWPRLRALRRSGALE